MSKHGYLLTGGRIVDGTGAPSYRADIAISGDRIARIAPSIDDCADLTVIDVSDLIVTPGFVDVHSHSDAEVFRNSGAEAKVFQGITHEVLGQDGMGYVPRRLDGLEQVATALQAWNGEPPAEMSDITSVAAYLESIEGRSATNIAMLAPHGGLRLMVMADPTQVATDVEVDAMCSILAEAFDHGAVGLSGGLAYYPGQFADSAELIALCRVVARYDGYFAPHHRNYGPRAFESYREMLEIAKAADVRLHLTHANLSFPINIGRAPDLLALIAEYQEQGCSITLDTYPYDSGATSLFELLPSWLKIGGTREMLKRLQQLGDVTALAHEMEVAGSDSFHHVPIDWDRISFSGLRHPKWKKYTGLSIAAAANQVAVEPTRLVVDALVASDLDVGVITHYGNADNMEHLLLDPRHCLGTDGLLAGDAPHPRAYGSFARYLAHYIRDEKRIDLAEGIRKITSLPASILRLAHRGKIQEGYYADIAVVNLPAVKDASSFNAPRSRAVGFPHVFVNGVPVVLDGKHTGSTPGAGLRPIRN